MVKTTFVQWLHPCPLLATISTLVAWQPIRTPNCYPSRADISTWFSLPIKRSVCSHNEAGAFNSDVLRRSCTAGLWCQNEQLSLHNSKDWWLFWKQIGIDETISHRILNSVCQCDVHKTNAWAHVNDLKNCGVFKELMYIWNKFGGYWIAIHKLYIFKEVLRFPSMN